MPTYLSTGDCVANIAMHHPNIEVYFSTSNNIKIHVDGNIGMEGRAFSIESGGLIGLTSIDAN